MQVGYKLIYLFFEPKLYIIIKYDQIHLFATGNNDEFLLLISQDTEASDAEDEDGDYASVEYRIFAENIPEIYAALQTNQALHPTEIEDENNGDFVDESEMFTADDFIPNGAGGDDNKFTDDV